jgi:hypothetical protein
MLVPRSQKGREKGRQQPASHDRIMTQPHDPAHRHHKTAGKSGCKDGMDTRRAQQGERGIGHISCRLEPSQTQIGLSASALYTQLEQMDVRPDKHLNLEAEPEYLPSSTTALAQRALRFEAQKLLQESMFSSLLLRLSSPLPSFFCKHLKWNTWPHGGHVILLLRRCTIQRLQKAAVSVKLRTRSSKHTPASIRRTPLPPCH